MSTTAIPQRRSAAARRRRHGRLWSGLALSSLAAALPLAVLAGGTRPDTAAAASPWAQTMTTTFATPASAGAVGNVYAQKIIVYTDSSQYKRANLSAHDGMLDVKLDGKTGAAFYFRPTPTTKGMTYGRYVVSFQVQQAVGNSAAFVLWPNSNVWSDGEIDFPEGWFDYPLRGWHHTTDPGQCASPPGCNEAIEIPASGSWRDPHVIDLRWSPTSVSYYLDGRLLKTVDRLLPVGDHRFTIQSAPTANSQPGHLYIYNATLYRWAG